MGSSGPNATDDKDFCDEHNITYESFSPLCGQYISRILNHTMTVHIDIGPCGTMELINGTLVTSIGAKYGKSGPQVLILLSIIVIELTILYQVALKWQVQQGWFVITNNLLPYSFLKGIPVIPKSDKQSHIEENIDLFDWELSTTDMVSNHICSILISHK